MSYRDIYRDDGITRRLAKIAERRSLAEWARDAVMDERFAEALAILGEAAGGPAWVCTHVEPDLDDEGSWSGFFCPEFGSFLNRSSPEDAGTYPCEFTGPRCTCQLYHATDTSHSPSCPILTHRYPKRHNLTWFDGRSFFDAYRGPCSGCGRSYDDPVHQNHLCGKPRFPILTTPLLIVP